MSLVLQSFLPFPDRCQGTSPHQQGRGTKMTEHCHCGIDVAKDRLDIQVLPHRQRFSADNNATGWAELVERLRAFTSILANFVNSPVPAVSSPRTIASMRS